jgi:hypothetical protein
LAADLDGDGRADLVYHDFVRGKPELGVCTAVGLRAAPSPSPAQLWSR